MTSPPPEQYWAGDVLIVGGGLVGLLTARELHAKGIECALLEQQGVGAGQSNHSHGYLHAGYVYLRSERELVAQLARARQSWNQLADMYGLEANTSNSLVCFTNGFNAAAAEKAWETAGLPVVPADPPRGFDASLVAASFLTEEATYDLTPLLTAIAAGLSDVLTVRGKGLRLIRKRGRVDSVEVDTSQGNIRLRARIFVLATGAQTEELVRTVTSFVGPVTPRTSFMLVVRGAGLEPASVVFPENIPYGLFLVSRELPEGDVVWLVSNFVSYGGLSREAEADRYWLSSMFRTLVRFAPGTRERGLLWGIYRAPKAELRADPRMMTPHATIQVGLDNLLLAVPTKVTLAPLLADEVATTVSSLLGAASFRKPTVPSYPHRDALPVVGERWTTVRLRDAVSLFERYKTPFPLIHAGFCKALREFRNTPSLISCVDIAAPEERSLNLPGR